MSDTVALLVIVLMLGVLAFLVPFAFHRTLLLPVSYTNMTMPKI